MANSDWASLDPDQLSLQVLISGPSSMGKVKTRANKIWVDLNTGSQVPLPKGKLLETIDSKKVRMTYKIMNKIKRLDKGVVRGLFPTVINL